MAGMAATPVGSAGSVSGSGAHAPHSPEDSRGFCPRGQQCSKRKVEAAGHRGPALNRHAVVSATIYQPREVKNWTQRIQGWGNRLFLLMEKAVSHIGKEGETISRWDKGWDLEKSFEYFKKFSFICTALFLLHTNHHNTINLFCINEWMNEWKK